MSAKPSLALRRRLNASPEKVYRAWIDPKKLVRWFGPDQGAVQSAETDARVGGRFHVIFRTEDGEQHDVSGEYREVEPNRKLVFTWMWRTMPERESLVTIALQEDGEGTLLTLLHERFFDEEARDRHREGWTGALAKLEGFVATADADE